jgi:hypothetical protein
VTHRHDDPLERLLRQAAQEFVYPPTPELLPRLAGRTVQPPRPQGLGMRRRWAIAAGVAVFLLLAVLAVTPPVRAVLYRVLRIGAVQILVDPTPASTPTPQATPAPPATAPPDLVLPSQLGGATTLAAAAAQVDFPVRLPTYPAALGPPDQVFVQEFGGANLALVWLAEDGARADLVLYELASDAVIRKVAPRVLEQTTVAGRPALWATGPYLMVFDGGNVDTGRLIAGQVLIWEEDGVTYRLETGADLAEARRIAESLVPLESREGLFQTEEEP